MYHTIDGRNVLVAGVDESIIDEDAVGIVAIVYHQLAVIHVGVGDFRILGGGQGGCLVSHIVITGIHHTVVDNHLADRVQNHAVSETFPRGFCDGTLGIESVQINLYSLIGGGKHGVISSCREQLEYFCLRHSADGSRLQQFDVLVIFFVERKVVCDGLLLKDISCRRVYIFGASNQDHG